MTTMSPVWSINLTDPTYTARLEGTALGVYGNPLWLSPTGDAVMEVQFYSTKFACWILLVRDHTTRSLPPGYREVAIDEMDQAAAAMLGMLPTAPR